MPTPIQRRKIVKKTTRTFLRHHADKYVKLRNKWRKPRGIDNRVRRRFKGARPMPSIGYGSNRKTRYLLPNKFYKFRVFNAKDLDVLLMNNRKYCAEIAACVSAKKRKEILDRAAQLDVKIINPHARMRTEENE
jgi:large subunit ribosomal protein L32e